MSGEVITRLLDCQVIVRQLKHRHPEILAGELWRELEVALYLLEVETA